MKPKAKVIKTELGWEPAFLNENDGEYYIEPGFALPTKKAAEADLEQSLRVCEQIDAQDRIYQAQYAYACGYRD